jgi:hypothetical protein
MTALFESLADGVTELRARLVGPLFSRYTFLPSALERALQASEADAERALRVLFGSVEVVPEQAPQADKDALTVAGTRWVEDPGYDMDPGFFHGDRWGFLVLRHRPVSLIREYKFVYPSPMSTVWAVPEDWIRLDRKFGHVNLVPGTQIYAAPFSAWLMAAIGGGRMIPRMIQVRYVAGIVNPAAAYPDIVDLVLQMASLRILQSLMLPGSGSISADGLSQSRSITVKDYQDDIDRRTERLRQEIHGVTMICV